MIYHYSVATLRNLLVYNRLRVCVCVCVCVYISAGTHMSMCVFVCV